MRRITTALSGRVSGVTAAVLLSLGMVTALAPVTPSAAATKYWPSVTVNHKIGVKDGQVLTVTGKGFPPNGTVTLYQCNQGVLNAPHGVINASTCDLTNTPTTPTSSTGTISTTFTVHNEQINGQAAIHIVAHGTIGPFEAWGWIHIEFNRNAYLTSSPTEPWRNPQTVSLTGLRIPAVAPGSRDVVAECNPNVLGGDTNACGPPAQVTVGSTGKATGKLSVVSGTVGDGTCGTGAADEVCYLVLANVTSTGTITPIAIEAIDFYEGQ
jgi:hypothetical protein